jgi:membrane fusion protein (multidrug efflux system)
MPSSFSRTIRSLEVQSEGRSLVALGGALLGLAAWTAWFALARLSVYVSSDTARLEVASATKPVDAPVAGRVIENDVTLDREVHEGDVLVALDSETERLRLAEAVAKERGISPQLAATRETLDAERRALADLADQSRAAIDAAKARVREAEVATKLANEEAHRYQSLRATGSVSEFDAVRSRAAADQKDAQLSAAESDLSRLDREFHTSTDDRRTRIAGLEREVSRLDADHDALSASIDAIKHAIELRVIRAPAGGRLGEIGTVRLGSVVHEGERIATIVTPGNLRVVAELPPASAIGRVKEGQIARVRLVGFPWTEFGELKAKVSNVASEVRENHARVDLVIVSGSPRVPLQHGMPASVEIEVERASPIQLVLRAAGGLFASGQEPQAPPPPSAPGGG